MGEKFRHLTFISSDSLTPVRLALRAFAAGKFLSSLPKQLKPPIEAERKTKIEAGNCGQKSAGQSLGSGVLDLASGINRELGDGGWEHSTFKEMAVVNRHAATGFPSFDNGG
jgi:hypothetical protein